MEEFYSIGVDPGFSGGFAIIHQKADGSLDVSVHAAPIIKTKAKGKAKAKNEYDVMAIAKTLRHLEHKTVYAYLERVSAMPGNGAVSMFHFGEGFGVWKGILGTLGFKLELVSPVTWKTEWVDKLIKKLEKPEILKLKQADVNRLSAADRKRHKEAQKQHKQDNEQAKKLAKDNARELAATLYPNLEDEFKLKKDDGKAEALLIAEYLRRQINAAKQ